MAHDLNHTCGVDLAWRDVLHVTFGREQIQSGYLSEAFEGLEAGDMVTSQTSLTILSAICQASSSCTTSMLLETSRFIAFGSLEPTKAAAVERISETALLSFLSEASGGACSKWLR